MTDYRRLRVPGGTTFLTINLLNRRSTLLTDQIDLLRHTRPFHIDAWVVLPEHMHCLWTLPEGDTDYSTRIRLIKTIFSKHTNPTQTPSKSRRAKQEKPIWQRRFWGHTIRDNQDYAAHMDYIHFNPVRHNLALTPPPGPTPTFHHHVKTGLYPPTWTTPITQMETGEPQPLPSDGLAKRNPSLSPPKKPNRRGEKRSAFPHAPLTP